MKILILCLITLFIILFWGSWFIVRRPVLLAVGALGGELKFWNRLPVSEEAKVMEAYQRIKHLLPETLKKRTHARNWKPAENSLPKVYVVMNKDWLYFFADYYPFKAPKIDVISGSTINSVHYHLKWKEFGLK